VAKGADCKSAGVRLRRFESYFPHQPSLAKRAAAAALKPERRRRARSRELWLGKPANHRRLHSMELDRMNYVYILQSVEAPDRQYVGATAVLRARLDKHNAGDVAHTSKYAPWRIKTYIAFNDRAQAFAFEKYLKSASGRAFAKKRL
jgi:putative endonuclease